MKAQGSLEAIFSHAVALSQSGRFKNEIFCKDNIIYVVNFDTTVILKFVFDFSFEGVGDEEISFEANDYDSNNFYIENNKIVFEQSAGGYIRKKVCGKAVRIFDDVHEHFIEFEKIGKGHQNILRFHKDGLPLLDDSLSHIEIKSQDKEVIIVQRDVYSGSLIELKREKKGFGFNIDSIKNDFGPIGLRTVDFFALFSFNDEIEFRLSSGPQGFIFLKGQNYNMTGVIAKCVYDEMGEITEVLEVKEREKKNGRKKPQVRKNKPKTNTKVNKRKRERKTEQPQKQRRRGIRVV